MKQIYELTKEEYEELQELLSWWREEKQKTRNNPNSIESYSCLEADKHKALSYLLP